MRLLHLVSWNAIAILQVSKPKSTLNTLDRGYTEFLHEDALEQSVCAPDSSSLLRPLSYQQAPTTIVATRSKAGKERTARRTTEAAQAAAQGKGLGLGLGGIQQEETCKLVSIAWLVDKVSKPTLPEWLTEWVGRRG